VPAGCGRFADRRPKNRRGLWVAPARPHSPLAPAALTIQTYKPLSPDVQLLRDEHSTPVPGSKHDGALFFIPPCRKRMILRPSALAWERVG